MLNNSKIRIIERMATPGMTVTLEESGLENANRPIVSGCLQEHVIGLLCRTSSNDTRIWHRLGKDNRFVPQGKLGYIPAEVHFDMKIQGHAPAWSVNCYFQSPHFYECTQLSNDWDMTRLDACHRIGSTAVTQIMWQLADELAAPGFSSGVVVESLGRLLMVQIARHFRSAVTEKSPGRLASWQLNRIREYVAATQGRQITLSELAGVCGVSAGYLRRVFKTSTHQTLGAYVEGAQIAKAKHLLQDGRMTLKQIAHQLGFSNPSSFSVAFKRSTGESPLQYRRRSSSSSSKTP